MSKRLTRLGDDPPGPDRTITAGAAKPEAQAVELGLTVLHYPDPHFVGAEIALLDSQVLLGREPGHAHDVALPKDDRASRMHARLTVFRGEYTIEDLDSKNKTFVDGVAIAKAPLRPGSIIRVGDTLLEFGPLVGEVPTGVSSREMVGSSRTFVELMRSIERVAKSDVSVLITGETGTGKELVADRLHKRSGRAGRLVAINCAAVPENLFESHLFGHKKGAFTGATSDFVGALGEAEGGTLFLDEIAELPLASQPKLLRMLESRQYSNVGSTRMLSADVRVIAATHADLTAEIARGRFRQDLYARLAGWIIETPPLRARKADIVALATAFFADAKSARDVLGSADLVERLLVHPWPMNVRELRTVVKRLALVEGTAELRATIDRSLVIAPSGPSIAPEPKTAEELRSVLRAHQGSISEVARHYGKDRKQIYRWLEKLGVSRDELQS